jgi:hypothetical protein
MVFVVAVMEGGRGEYAAARRSGGSFGRLCYDIALPPGALGGPVLDARGSVRLFSASTEIYPLDVAKKAGKGSSG